ncbi:hypothetical protein ACLGI4_09990 [Streptomyces sp. HMX112]|uniref:hypothetical protein n=1 Tax=Streptomyces sp. HMX112 TaxID=3390850 RepID=UPI003A804555
MDSDNIPFKRAPRPRRPPGPLELLLGLALLLGVVVAVHLVTGNPNVALVVASVTGLYGLWHIRR